MTRFHSSLLTSRNGFVISTLALLTAISIRSKLGENLLHHLLHVFTFAYGSHCCQRPGGETRCFRLRRFSIERAAGTVVDDHIGALSGERRGDGLADAAAPLRVTSATLSLSRMGSPRLIPSMKHREAFAATGTKTHCTIAALQPAGCCRILSNRRRACAPAEPKHQPSYFALRFCWTRLRSSFVVG